MDNKKGNNKISFKVIWSLCMSLVYFLIAYLVAFTPLLLPYNYRQQVGENQSDDFLIPRVILGFALFAYGLFRIYQVIKYRR